MKSLHLAAALAAIVALGCSSDSPIGIEPEVALSETAQMVPFKATAQSIEVVPPAITCPSGFPSEFTDAGHATQLGKFSGSHWICSVGPVPGPVPGTFVFQMVSSEAVWVAANGDELWMRLNPLLGGRTVFTVPALTFVTTAANDIIGGTGRFAGATGLVNLVVDGKLGDPAIIARLDGTISSQSGRRP